MLSVSISLRMYGLEVSKLAAIGFPGTLSGNSSAIKEKLGRQNPKVLLSTHEPLLCPSETQKPLHEGSLH